MTETPSNRSDCEAPRDSRRPLTGMQMNVAVSYTATYTNYDGDGNQLGGHTVTMSGGASKGWAKIPYPLVDSAITPPQTGNMYVVQLGCCCKCRTAFLIDEQTFGGLGGVSGLIAIPFTLRITRQEFDADGNPQGDPIIDDLPKGVSIELWPQGAPPCQRSDQYTPGLLTATLRVPVEPLTAEEDIYPPDNVGTSIAGAGNPVESDSQPDPALFNITFTNPDPCNEAWQLSATIVRTWTGEAIDATGTINVGLSVFGEE